MAGSQVDQACAFCASSHVEPLRRAGLNGDLTVCRCLTCNKTWAEALGSGWGAGASGAGHALALVGFFDRRRTRCECESLTEVHACPHSLHHNEPRSVVNPCRTSPHAPRRTNAGSSIRSRSRVVRTNDSKRAVASTGAIRRTGSARSRNCEAPVASSGS
jgi:hypothetical protein